MRNSVLLAENEIYRLIFKDKEIHSQPINRISSIFSSFLSSFSTNRIQLKKTLKNTKNPINFIEKVGFSFEFDPDVLDKIVQDTQLIQKNLPSLAGLVFYS